MQVLQYDVIFIIAAFSSSEKLDPKRRRTERIRRDHIDSPMVNDLENRRHSRSNSQSDPIRRGRGRPKTVGLKKPEEEKGHFFFWGDFKVVQCDDTWLELWLGTNIQGDVLSGEVLQDLTILNGDAPIDQTATYWPINDEWAIGDLLFILSNESWSSNLK